MIGRNSSLGGEKNESKKRGTYFTFCILLFIYIWDNYVLYVAQNHGNTKINVDEHIMHVSLFVTGQSF